MSLALPTMQAWVGVDDGRGSVPPLPAFKKPVPTNPPMKEWPAEYLKRRAEVGNSTVSLDSGRHIAYWRDSSDIKTDTDKIVICLHGMMVSKNLWLLPKPIPGVCQIAIDRFAHGSSSEFAPGRWKEPEKLELDAMVPDYCEAISKIVGSSSSSAEIKKQKLYVIGYSGGGFVAQGIAAQLHREGRLAGLCILASAPSAFHQKLDLEAYHTGPKFTGQTLKSQAKMFRSIANPGCCCTPTLCKKKAIDSMMKGLTFKRKDVDPGFAMIYKDIMSNPKEDGGNKQRNEEMAQPQNAFMVAATLEAYLNGQHHEEMLLMDGYGFFLENPKTDSNTIGEDAEVVVRGYYGTEDNAMPPVMGDWLVKAYPQAKVHVFDGHGHCTIFLELEQILREFLGME